jgi:hypothetical protein
VPRCAPRPLALTSPATPRAHALLSEAHAAGTHARRLAARGRDRSRRGSRGGRARARDRSRRAVTRCRRTARRSVPRASTAPSAMLSRTPGGGGSSTTASRALSRLIGISRGACLFPDTGPTCPRTASAGMWMTSSPRRCRTRRTSSKRSPRARP